MLPDLDRLDALMPQLLRQLPAQIDALTATKTTMLTMYSTQNGLLEQTTAMQDNQAALGAAFNDAKNDDTFYLPPEVFDNEGFQRELKTFLSPDGHAVRFIVSHDGDPLTPEGIQHAGAIKHAAKEAMKGTPLEGSRIFVGGTASVFKDMQDGNNYDLLAAGIAALCLIFVIMLIITRSAIAAAVIVGTVVVSLGGHLSACRSCCGNT